MEGSLNFSNSSDMLTRCIYPNLVIAFAVWVLVYSLCIPVLVLVLFVCFKKWKKHGSGNFSHSDIFTFNIVLMETCGIIGSILLNSGLHLGLFSPRGVAGANLIYMNGFGQGFFQCLTCVDRFLAVVFPVRYLRLRKGRGATVRNIIIVCVWLMCIGRVTFVFKRHYFDEPISSFILCVSGVVIVTFCCVSILCVLIRPKPGEMTVDRKKVDQSKRRAFNTMLVILGVLLMKFVSDTQFYVLSFMMNTTVTNKCLVFLVALWGGLPNSLVLPLLFLHRAGTLKACIK